MDIFLVLCGIICVCGAIQIVVQEEETFDCISTREKAITIISITCLLLSAGLLFAIPILH